MKKVLINLILILSFVTGCDSSKNPSHDLTQNLLCYAFAECGNSPGTKFAMIGDSWTDLLFGVPAIQTLRYHLENNFGYKITGATIGGQELNTVVSTGLHLRTIRQSGNDLRFVILSLGGNDLQFRPEAFAEDPAAERQRRFTQIESNLRKLIVSGNLYKQNKFGGRPLTWIIHGYDYPNPFNEAALSATTCKSSLNRAGIPDSDFEEFTTRNLDSYNALLNRLSSEIPGLKYIDLRKSLGGPPYSDESLMFDCIHPNSQGFFTLTNRFVSKMRIWTGDLK